MASETTHARVLTVPLNRAFLNPMLECLFPRRVDALSSVFAHVREFFASHGLPAEQAFDVELILEELFVNMVKHTSDGRNDIAIGMDWDGTRLTLTLRDFDVEPFDVAAAPRVDLNRPLHERKPGGLGIHLVRALADTLHYEYAGRTSTVTVTKRLEL